MFSVLCVICPMSTICPSISFLDLVFCVKPATFPTHRGPLDFVSVTFSMNSINHDISHHVRTEMFVNFISWPLILSWVIIVISHPVLTRYEVTQGEGHASFIYTQSSRYLSGIEKTDVQIINCKSCC